MTSGITISPSGVKYIFTVDGFDKIVAWEVHEFGARPRSMRGSKIPKKYFCEIFDIEKPPRTVSYQPTIGPVLC